MKTTRSARSTRSTMKIPTPSRFAQSGPTSMSSTTASSGSSSISLMSRCSNMLALLPSVMQLIFVNCAQESADLFSICIRFHRSHPDQPNYILQFVILRHDVCSPLECPRSMSKMFSLDITSQVLVACDDQNLSVAGPRSLLEVSLGTLQTNPAMSSQRKYEIDRVHLRD